jgi:DinB superfamily
MKQPEKLAILEKLKAGRDALVDAVAGVDDEWALRRGSPERWSVLNCVEHVVATEQYLLTRLQAATMSEQPFEKWRREEKIASLAMDRTRRIEAPEQVHPHGRYKTLAAAMAAFEATRAEVVCWVENCSSDLRCMMTDHALIEGPVTCAEMLIMIAAHPARHAEQIEEVRSQWKASSQK